MKLLAFLSCILLIIAFASAEPVFRHSNHDQRFFWIPDEQGKLHFVDIHATPRFVDPIDSNNITLLLFTPGNVDVPVEFHPHQLEILISSGLFDPNRPTLLSTHGWTGTGDSVHMVDVKDTILAQHKFNIINIDWAGPANTFYTQAVQYVNPLGDILGDFVKELTDYYQISRSTIGLMGHSLGGQLAGRIGYSTYGELAYIIAFDPAFPSFSTDNLPDRLDKSDAQYVQIVHANSGFLGVPDSIGDADFYPNGGVKQLGCGPDIFGMCSHFLIKDMIAESYVSTYLSWRCDSYEDFVSGQCENNETGFWGGWPVDIKSSGDYFLTTNGSPPFVIPQNYK